MSETADPLVLDFVEWVAREPRAYAEVISTWKTSCPRLTIWEDAADRGYVARETLAGVGLIIAVTEDGERLLRANGRLFASPRSRGEAGICASKFRVRGSLRESVCHRNCG